MQAHAASNIGKGVKNRLIELKELLDRISFYKQSWTTATVHFKTSWRKEENTSEGEFIKVVPRVQEKQTKEGPKETIRHDVRKPFA